MVGLGGLEPPTSPLSGQLDLVLQQKTAGTAKIRGSRTRHRMLWVGKAREFCGNPHFHFLEIRSSVGIILRRRFGKPPLSL